MSGPVTTAYGVHGINHLQRHDEDGRFDTDEEAQAHVVAALALYDRHINPDDVGSPLPPSPDGQGDALAMVRSNLRSIADLASKAGGDRVTIANINCEVTHALQLLDLAARQPVVDDRDAIADLVEGMSVSIDVDGLFNTEGRRLFGTVTEAMEDCDSEHGLILLVQDAKPNWIAARQPVVALADSRKGRIYIAGPMTGYENYNFAAFNAAAQKLRDAGFVAVNPADHGIVTGAGWSDYLRDDIAKLATCEAIHFLPGWSKSKGAALEHHIAVALGMGIQFAEGAEHPPVGQEPIMYRVRCELHPYWRKVDAAQFAEYTSHGWEGQKLYAAPTAQAVDPEQEVAMADLRATLVRITESQPGDDPAGLARDALALIDSKKVQS